MQDTDIIYSFQEKKAYVGAVDNVIPSLWAPVIAPPYVIMSHVTKKCLSSPLSHCCCAQHRESEIRIQILLEPLLFIEALKL